MCIKRTPRAYPPRQAGVSLVELIMFIVIVGIGLAGITGTYNIVVRNSADPMVRKQALVIAESLLLEIEQQPFTWCDPQDANALTPSSTANCASSANNQNTLGGPTPAGETRGNPSNPFDNVADYSGLTNVPASALVATEAGTAVADFTVSVSMTQVGANTVFAASPALPASPAMPADAALRIEVTVTGRGQTVSLVGYRFRYAPNAAG